MSEDAAVPPATEPGDDRELSCEESLALVYEYLDGELGADQNHRVRAHLEKCRKCYPHFNFERLFLDYLHEVGGRGRARPELERRVRQLLRDEDGRGDGP